MIRKLVRLRVSFFFFFFRTDEFSYQPKKRLLFAHFQTNWAVQTRRLLKQTILLSAQQRHRSLPVAEGMGEMVFRACCQYYTHVPFQSIPRANNMNWDWCVCVRELLQRGVFSYLPCADTQTTHQSSMFLYLLVFSDGQRKKTSIHSHVTHAVPDSPALTTLSHRHVVTKKKRDSISELAPRNADKNRRKHPSHETARSLFRAAGLSCRQ